MDSALLSWLVSRSWKW